MNGVPEGFQTATPYLIVPDAERVVAFYKKAFGAVELNRFVSNGVLRNVEIRIGSSPIMISGHAEMRPNKLLSFDLPSLSIYLYVEDADALFARAIAAGANELYPVQEQFYGNREGGLEDPFGFTWWIATKIEDVSEAELRRRVEETQPG